MVLEAMQYSAAVLWVIAALLWIRNQVRIKRAITELNREVSKLKESDNDQPGKSAFLRKLQSMRERRHLSRQRLADLCGISQSTIAKYERGERFPTIDVLIMLADLFDTSIDELVGRK